MRIGFTSLRAGLPSHRIRAEQVAAAIGAEAFPYSLERAAECEVLVYIKYPPSREDASELRRRGVRQIVDVLDNYNSGMLQKRDTFIDGYIAAAVSHEEYLGRIFGRERVRYIPHHHANFGHRKIETKESGALTIGYVGSATHWPANRFVLKRFPDAVADFEYRDLERTYLSLDIGFAYRTDRHKARYNSNLKLLNYMSFGIPSVVTPEKSFLEIAEHGVDCFFAESKSEFVACVARLCGDVSLRHSMSDSAFAKASRYGIEQVAGVYRGYFAGLSGTATA